MVPTPNGIRQVNRVVLNKVTRQLAPGSVDLSYSRAVINTVSTQWWPV